MQLTEMTSVLLERALARTEAAEGPAFFEAVEAFNDLGRGVRLSIALDLRLAAFARIAAEPVRLRVESTEPSARPERGDPREREREVESDGFPMDPMGRVTALETLLIRTPDLDPGGKVSAEIIELKAFLEGSKPPEPRGPAAVPSTPTTRHPNRPPNRAERRRQRHASG